MLVLPAFAQQQVSKVPDIIIDSKLDFDWSEMLVQKIRRYMLNNGYGDPFSSRVETEVVIADLTSQDLVAPESKKLLQDLGQMLGVKLLNARSKITLKNFAYEIGSVRTNLKASSREKSGLVINGDFTAGGIRVEIDEIKLILELPTANGGKMPLLEVSVVKPKLVTKGEGITVSAGIQVVESRDTVSFKVLNSDFNQFADQLADNPAMIDLSYEDLIIPEVSIRIGTKQINIKPEKVKAFITAREENLKQLMIDQLRLKLKEGAAAPMLAAMDSLKIPREYWIHTDSVSSRFTIGKVSTSVFDKNLQVDMPADFCMFSQFGQYSGNCVNFKPTKIPESVITADNHKESIHNIKDILNSGSANLVASVSEDYINKLLGATYDAGFYTDMLNEAGASLGPKRAFLRLDEKGETGTLYADVLYKITGFQGTMVGRKEIRFPLVIKCAMRFEKRAGSVPVLLIKLVDADLSDQVLRYGLPELGLESTIQKVPRFKGKVIKAIRESTAAFIGKDVVALNYPEFRGMGLETVNFISDGNGRMGAQVQLDALVNSALEDEESN